MREIKFFSTKIERALNLPIISDFFKLHGELKWKEYIVLGKSQLEFILKYDCIYKEVYIYDFGSITFINFEEDEMRVFINLLNSIVPVDYNMVMNYYEVHKIIVDDKEYCRIHDEAKKKHRFDDDIIKGVSNVMAKSSALSFVEKDLNSILADTDTIINNIGVLKLRANSKNTSMWLAKIVRYKYEIIRSINIFDKPLVINQSNNFNDIYNEIANYFELFDRYKNLDNKVNNIKTITHNYFELSHIKREKRLYYFEIFLLLLFPMVSLFGDRINIDYIINLLSNYI